MKELILKLILTGWCLGLLISFTTDNLYIPAITIFIFVLIAFILFLINLDKIITDKEKK